MPGRPLSAWTTSPESSPSAAWPETWAAVRALTSAFSTKLLPVSGGCLTSNSDCGLIEKPCESAMASNSVSLPAFPDATTSVRFAIVPAPSVPVQRSVPRGHQLFDTGACQVQHPVELAALKSMPFSRTLYLDKPAAVVHDDVKIGIGG